MLIDTHCHLDDERYMDDLEEVLQRAKDAEVEKIVIPGADPKTLPRAVELSQKYDNIYFAVGVHPYDASNYDRSFLEQFIENKKCVAVGECGLDYYRLSKDKDEADADVKRQKEVFIDQIELANRYKLPLIVHIRDASCDSFDILKKYSRYGGVLHCYNADHQLLKLAEDGFYYGIGGVITFKNARKLIEVYPKIPKNRVLIETDGPYLTPHPHRGKRNEPAYCKYIVQKMAELSKTDYESIASLTTLNAKSLFGL